MSKIAEMKNVVIQNYGMEDPVTIMFFEMCERGEDVETLRAFIESWNGYYIACMAG